MEAPAWMFTKALNHRQKVLRLFKRSHRMVEWWYSPDVLECRFHQVVLRSRFDKHKDEQDMKKARQMLIDGCRELWEKKCPGRPMAFARDPFGIAYSRKPINLDFMADNSSLAEREQFPYYFNRRERRKKELLAHWEKIEAAWDDELTSIQRKPPPE